MAEIIRVAVGQSANIGTLYDAANDEFLDASILKGDVHSQLISIDFIQEVTSFVVPSGGYKEKFDALGVNGDTTASILVGLCKPQGCGLYLCDDLRDAICLQGACHQRISTVQQKLSLRDTGFRQHIDSTPLAKYHRSTHMVVGINWGLRNIIATKTYLDDLTGSEAIQSILNNDLKLMQDLIDVRAGSEDPHSSSPAGLQLQHEFTVYSDALPNGGLFVQDLSEAKQFIQLAPDHISQHCDGKGWPMSYVLMPLSMLHHFAPIPEPVPASSSNLGPEYISSIVKLFDEFVRREEELRSYRFYLTGHRRYASQGLHRGVDTAIAQLLKLKHLAATRLMEALVQTRQGTSNATILAELCSEFAPGGCYPTRIAAIAEQEISTISFISKTVARGAIYLGYNRLSPDKVIAAQGHNDCYMLLFRKHFSNTSAAWTENCSLLDELLSQGSRDKTVYIVDCDVTSIYPDLKSPRIRHLRSGKEVAFDLLEHRKFVQSQCFARFRNGSLDVSDALKPVQRRFVRIPCPGKDCDPTRVCEWLCATCFAPIECGFTDEYIYCDCGRSLYSSYEFRCNGGRHGNDYETYNPTLLFPLLQKLDQSDYLNILIMGETGVGKSTFINAFINYLTYSNLDEAMAADKLESVIPCSFCIQVMDRNNPDAPIQEKLIQVGSRDDEVDGAKGSSATQQTNVYAVTIGSTTYRLIDTPGIGDTRGYATDKKNMADILNTLSGYESLHGILFLLKSNNARLTITLKFCIKELLAHLHRSAAENIVFGFTNTRISNYTPGDTFGPLKTLLQEHPEIGLKLSNTITYCFDSESFRYLASYKSGVPQGNEEDFRRSWDHSSKEARRLIKHFSAKTPHNVINTISLNGARNLVMELTKPMAEIAKLIRDNITVLEDQMEQLKDSKVTTENLRKKLHIRKIQFESKQLAKARTVCKRRSCCDFKDSGKGDGEVVTIYKTHCHPVCRLKKVRKDVVADPGLLRCAAFSEGICQVCRHQWNEHLHVLYELKEVTVEVRDSEIEHQLKLNADDLTLRQTGLQQFERLIAEYKEEHKCVQEAAARFGVFLKTYSMTPINDATLEYIDMLMQDEEMKIAGGQQTNQSVERNQRRLEGLQEDKAAHIELVEALNRSMTSDDGSVSYSLDEKDVEQLVKKLYGQKHFGDNLQKVQDTVASAYRSTNRERSYRVQKTDRQEAASRNKPTWSSMATPRLLTKASQAPEQKQSLGGKILGFWR